MKSYSGRLKTFYRNSPLSDYGLQSYAFLYVEHFYSNVQNPPTYSTPTKAP